VGFREEHLPWDQQPQEAVEVDRSNPLSSALIYADPGGARDSVSATTAVVSGAKQVVTARGVATGFGATFGTGGTDAVTSPIRYHAPRRTYFFRVLRNGAGGGSAGRLFDVGASGARTLFWNGTFNAITFNALWQTSFGQWYAPAGSTPTGAIQSVCITYDQSSVSNDPVIYLDGVSVAVTESLTPAGLPWAETTDPFVFGNRAALDRGWDGWIGEVFVWDRLLSPSEVAEVHANPWQLFQPRSIPVPLVASGGGVASLVPADAAHAHTADSLTLSTGTGLAVADAAQGQASDSPTLTTATSLLIADATHGHAADSLGLSTTGETALSVADASHAQVADSLDLDTALTVQIASAEHGHSVEGLALTTEAWLAAADAQHSQTAEGLSLVTTLDLVVSDAGHAQLADIVALLPTGGSASAAEVWSYVLADGRPAGETMVENARMLRIVLAALSGTTEGIGTATETYFGEDGTTPRIVATFDGNGNRVSVLTDGSP
jgi:hypothetical protein